MVRLVSQIIAIISYGDEHRNCSKISNKRHWVRVPRVWVKIRYSSYVAYIISIASVRYTLDVVRNVCESSQLQNCPKHLRWVKPKWTKTIFFALFIYTKFTTFQANNTKTAVDWSSTFLDCLGHKNSTGSAFY